MSTTLREDNEGCTQPQWLIAPENLIKDSEGGATSDSVVQVVVSNTFVQHLLDEDLTLFEWYHSGIPKVPVEEIYDFINGFDLFLIHKDMSGKGGPSYFYVGDECTFKIGPSADRGGNDDDDGGLWVEVMCSNAELMEEFRLAIRGMLIKKPRKGSVYALVSKSHGLEFTSMGIGGSDLIRENYAADVLEAYDQIVSDLRSNEPSGRLAIIDGPAGTGKTHMVRGLLTDVRAMFVMISPEAITQLASPQIIPLLIETREENSQHGGQPIIFILEDADSALVPRDTANMSIISSLLNYTDGIFGTLFDLRVIATTNQPKIDIEEALMRAGRLSCQVTVGKLSAKEANAVYQRLTEGKHPEHTYDRSMSLADIYAEAHGFKTTKQKDNRPEPAKLGFTTKS